MGRIKYSTNSAKFRLIFAEDKPGIDKNLSNVTATFAFVRDEEGKLLVLKNERGWDIPGGHLNDGESILEATHREVLEESCVTIDNLKLYAIIMNGNTSMTVFTAEPNEVREFVQNEEDPTSDRTFMDIDDFMRVYSGGDKNLMYNLIAKLPDSVYDN